MNGIKSWTVPLLALLLAAGTAYADEEATMTVMPQAELPDAVTDAIELPDEASEEGVASSAEGLATANEARQRRLEGLETAQAARERGAEFGAEHAENARDARENFGRGIADGNRPADLPHTVPELPQQPETPPVP
jgi:hypothetical protein